MLYKNILYTWSKLRSSTPRNFPELYHDSWRQSDPGQVKVTSNWRHEDIRGVGEFSVFLNGQRQWRWAWSKGRGDHTIGFHLPLAPEQTEKRFFTSSSIWKATQSLQTNKNEGSHQVLSIYSLFKYALKKMSILYKATSLEIYLLPNILL